jgi:two-component system, chemotaxis family, chemotaxis protein CheY
MGRSVLIVDDCPAVRVVIRRILGISGFEMSECYLAGDGNEALAVLGRHRVDLVISDVNMPRLDGEGLLQRLVSDEKLCKVPVVMVTSDATESRAARLLGMGAKGYIVKPFQPEALRAELERVMGALHD